MNYMEIIIPILVFLGLGLVMGVLLALSAQVFTIKRDKRIDQVLECLPGANCGGCGYPGCSALAEAIVKSDAKPNKCSVCNSDAVVKMSEIMGIEAEASVRMRAQVMCSGTHDLAKKKYSYDGVADCVSAVRVGGGDKMCPNGCIGLGTCAEACPFGAIKVINGVAVVDYSECQGCGVCVAACPKHIIKLIPFDSAHWVGCMSVEKAKETRESCDVGCICCRICEKNCPEGAITVNDFVASIDYSKCTDCGICVSKCPRKIIWSAHRQGKESLVIVRVPEKKEEK